MEITRAQALAFADTLIGWEIVGDEQAKPKSPHALTHLEAVFGRNALIAVGNWRWETTIGLLAEYLAAVAEQLKLVAREGTE